MDFIHCLNGYRYEHCQCPLPIERGTNFITVNDKIRNRSEKLFRDFGNLFKQCFNTRLYASFTLPIKSEFLIKILILKMRYAIILKRLVGFY